MRSTIVRRIAIIAVAAALGVVSMGGVSGAQVSVPETPPVGPPTDPLADPFATWISDPFLSLVDDLTSTVEETLNPSSEPPPGEDPGPGSGGGGGEEPGVETSSGGITGGENQTGATSPSSTTGAGGQSSATGGPTATFYDQVPAAQRPVSTSAFDDFLAAIQRIRAVERQYFADDDFADYHPTRRGPRSTLDIIETLRKKNASPSAIARIIAPFPVAGEANYSDDWGNQRSKPVPHVHKGVDILAARGTPVVASADGMVQVGSSPDWGGNWLSLTGVDGTRYYYAHLDSYAPLSTANVSQGQILGYVGSTGNAEGGVPHLHFEIHPDGAEAVPPVPYLDRWLVEALAAAKAFATTHEGSANPLEALRVVRDKITSVAASLGRATIQQPALTGVSATGPMLPPLLAPTVALALLMVWRRRRKMPIPVAVVASEQQPSDGWWVELP